MSSDAISLWTETSSDPELIAGVRAGDTAAFGVLYERHVEAARKVAAMYTNTAADIDDVVSESFSRVLRALQRGDGPDLAFRAYLFTIVRRTGMDIINKGIRTKPRDDMGEFESNMGYGPSSDEPAIEGFEHGMVADAFKSLPERWQAVLWYTEVEKKSPREIAPLLGLSANGVAALSYRAREALRQAYLQQHLNTADTVSCLEANAQLGAYVRGGLNKREQAQVGTHVETCERCAALVAELEDVNRGMRGIIAPLVLGIAGMAALEGGLPIGGAFGPGAGEGAGSAASGAGSSSGTSVTAGASAGGSVAAGGIATGSATAGGATAGGVAAGGSAAAGASGVGAGIATGATATGGGFAVGGSMAGMMSGFAGVALPAVAAVAIVALAVNAAGALGFIGDAPGSSQGDEVAVADARVLVPGPKDGAAPTEPVEPPALPPELPTLPGTSDDSPANPSPSEGGTTTPPAGGAGAGTGTGTGTGSGTGTGTGAGSGPSTPDPESTEPPVDPTPPPPPPPTTFALLSIGQAPLDYLEILRSSPVMSMTVANDGDGSAEDVTSSITLPDGLEFAAPSGGGASFAVIQAARVGAYLQFATTGTFAAGEWACELEDDASVAVCVLPDLAPGASATLDLDLEVVTSGDLAPDAVTQFTVGYGDVTESYSVRTGLEDVQEDLDLRYAASGQVAATQVGAPLMSCDLTDNACQNAMAFAGSASQNVYNNNNWSMIPLNEADGDTNSATTNLVLPVGAQVLYASLEWSGNAGATDTFDRPLTGARIKAPGASEYVDIAADGPAMLSSDSGGERQYYQSQVDITDLVQQYGAGQWSVADIALSATRNDPDPSYYGGFAITVIYSHADLPDSRVALFDGTDWVQTGDSTTFTFVTDATSDVTVGWVAWEGDRGILGDQVDINSDNLVPMRWNPGGSWPSAATPTGDSGNAADSTAYGSKYANSLGVDAKPFRTISLGAGTHVLTASTSTDQYLIGALTVTIAYDD